MRLQQFLEHHGLRRNPFTEEDAVVDPVFREHCISSTFHPAWDKIYGDPCRPSTAIVFGEKGSGKTALRLQMEAHLRQHNRHHPHHRVFVIQYTDFNRFLDQFRNSLPVRWRKPEELLSRWRLWDHLDAILCLGVTDLVDRILEQTPQQESEEPLPLEALERTKKRDLLLLAACYDQSFGQSRLTRWQQLARRLGFSTWSRWWPWMLGTVGTVVFPAVAFRTWGWTGLLWPWTYAPVLLSWLPLAAKALSRYSQAWGVQNQVRVLNHEWPQLGKLLMYFSRDDLGGQPLPVQQRDDDRYELLQKFQGVLRALGYRGLVVLVDRVDEPHLIGGSAQRMKSLVWPLLDNKLLSQEGVGFKLLLPVELMYFVEREGPEFHQRARLDKHNLIRSLEWTGESLLDVAQDRLRACAQDGREPKLTDLFDTSISLEELIAAFNGLRTPRNLFKFMFELISNHCQECPELQPQWRISRERFKTQLALFQKNLQMFSSPGVSV